LTTSKQARFLLPHYSLTKQIVKISLLVAGSIFLALALLRPQWDKKEHVVAQEGRDLFIALDISRSMLAQDCKPNRLTCAKEKIRTLLTLLGCERVGLILFSGSTFVQCPLTTDYSAFHMYLNQIDAETISSGTTALDQVLRKAITIFKELGERKHKLLVIFTDGEDFSSDLSGIKQEAVAMGLTIFTVGVGTHEGAPIPLVDIHGKPIGHQLDKKGAVVISHLNEGILTTLARDCGGTYISMTPDISDMQTLVKCVQRFEKEKLEDKKVSLFQEQYHYLVALSFICLLLEWIL
jgi:Ca-activated chloride channel family protein